MFYKKVNIIYKNKNTIYKKVNIFYKKLPIFYKTNFLRIFSILILISDSLIRILYLV